MASTEEKLLTLLLTAEHLKDAAKEQQSAVADSLSAARETLKDYRAISQSVAKRVQDEVSKGVQQMDVATVIGDRISADFVRLETAVEKIRISAEALDKDINKIRQNVTEEYSTLKGFSWYWIIGCVVVFCAFFFLMKMGMDNALNDNYNATSAVWNKIDRLEKQLIDNKVIKTKENTGKTK
jgi:hypothetical protein